MRHKTYHFKNGATLVYKKAREKNATAIKAGFMCGSKYVVGGLPHFSEHVIGEQTATKSRKDIKAERELLETHNRSTSERSLTAYAYQSNRKEKLIWEHISQTFFDSVIDEEIVNTHRKIILQERANVLRREQEDDNFLKRHYTFVTKKYDGVVDLVNSTIGTEEFLKSVQIKDIKDFIDKNFVSDKFLISVCSSRSFCKVKRLTQKYFISRLKQPETPSNILDIYATFDKADKLRVEKKPESEVIKVAFSLCLPAQSPERTLEMQEPVVLRNCFVYNAESLANRLRDAGLVYMLPGISFISNEKRTDVMARFSFTTSLPGNVDKIFEIYGQFIKEIKSDFITEEDIKKFKDDYYMSQDRRLIKEIRATERAEDMFFRQANYGDKWPKFTKWQWRKQVKQMSLKKVKDFANFVFDKQNSLAISFLGNLSDDQIKDISYYKNMLFPE